MNLTPKQIVAELDKYIIGQKEAKKAVAIALRNRYRRSKLTKEEMEEITPKNIIMKGPTGVGKTEIARRLAKLVGAPFIKVEATKSFFVKLSSSTSIGNLPCNSGIKSETLETWNAPAAINKI